MRTVTIVRRQDGDGWIGYLQDYPDYWTQGETIGELEENLRDIYSDITSGLIPAVRMVQELIVA